MEYLVTIVWQDKIMFLQALCMSHQDAWAECHTSEIEIHFLNVNLVLGSIHISMQSQCWRVQFENQVKVLTIEEILFLQPSVQKDLTTKLHHSPLSGPPSSYIKTAITMSSGDECGTIGRLYIGGV